MVAAITLIVILPVLLMIGLVIRVTSEGPALFRQPRVGKDGKLFVLYKFRTMVQNAEAVKHELAQRDDGNGVLFKMRRDPRVTPVGAVLRRYSSTSSPSSSTCCAARCPSWAPARRSPRRWPSTATTCGGVCWSSRA